MTPKDAYISYRIGRLFGKKDIPMSRSELQAIGFDDEEKVLFWEGYSAGHADAIRINKKD